MLAGIAPAAPAPAATVQPLVIETGRGPVRFQVELASTPEEQARGLMFRGHLGPASGMLFDFEGRSRVAMWMKNTLIPLDMLFIDAAGRVVQIAAMTEPHSLDVIEGDGATAAVLEIAGGRAAEAGITVGDRVRHPLFEGAP